MRNVFLGVVLLLCQANFVAAQASYSESGGVIMHVTLDEKETVNLDRARYTGKPHVLGDSITSLLDKVEQTYVYYQEVGGAYASKEMKIEKKEIYYPLQKVLKYYDKALRKDKIAEEEAHAELVLILNNAVKLKNYETDQFELLLKETKNKEALADMFLKVKFM